jgi:hypothetical protein
MMKKRVDIEMDNNEQTDLTMRPYRYRKPCPISERVHRNLRGTSPRVIWGESRFGPNAARAPLSLASLQHRDAALSHVFPCCRRRNVVFHLAWACLPAAHQQRQNEQRETYA